MSERFRIYLSYFFICTIWGSTWLVIKIGLESVTPLLAAGLRFVVASSILFALLKIRGITIPKSREARRLYVIIALISFSIPFGLIYWGEGFIPSGLTSILFALYPFAVALFSFLFLPSEKITKWKIAGIIIGFFGVVIIFFNDIGIHSSNALPGMAAVVASALLQALSVIVIKKFGHGIHPFALTFVPMAYSAAILLTASLVFEDFTTIKFTWRSWCSIFYLGIFGSVVAFVSYFWLLKRVEAVFLSLTSFITPIIAVVLGIVILGEKFSNQVFIGAAVVLIGIAVANFADFRKILSGKEHRAHIGADTARNEL